MNPLVNFLQHPKTTIAGLLGGTAAGAAALLAFGMVTAQAGCNFATVNWLQVAEVVMAGSATGGVVGGVMRDGSKLQEVKPS